MPRFISNGLTPIELSFNNHGFANFSSVVIAGGVGAPPHTNALWVLEDSDDNGVVIATVDGSGIITLVRPPTGLRYHYRFWFTFFRPNNLGMTMVFAVKDGGATPLITMTDGSANGINGQHHLGSMPWCVAVDDAGLATLPNQYELQVAGGWSGAEPQAINENKMIITRMARQ